MTRMIVANRTHGASARPSASIVLGWIFLPLSVLFAVSAWVRALVMGLWLVPKSLETTRDFGLQTNSTLGKAAISISDWLGGRPGAAPGWMLVAPLLAIGFVVIGAVGWRRRWTGIGLAVAIGLTGWALTEMMRFGMVDVLQEFIHAMDRTAAQAGR